MELQNKKSDLSNNRKERISGCDFVRAVSALGIIIFHFSCHSNSTFRPLLFHKNGDYGIVFVTVFFLISGAMLYYNYMDGICLKDFYVKRFKSIYPMYYLAFLYYYIENVFQTSNWFYNGNPKSLLLTLVGLDGYFSYRINNYFLVGEWFVGAIIIIYLIFPLLLFLFNKSSKITTIITVVGYGIALLLYHNGLLKIPYHQNIWVCLLSFEVGMLILKHRSILESKLVFIVAIACSIILAGVKVPVLTESMAGHLLGIALFFVLFHIGDKLMSVPALGSAISRFGKLSYPIFLIQHQVILKVLAFRNPVSPVYSMITLLLVIAMILVEAKILDLITTAILKSKLFTAAR